MAFQAILDDEFYAAMGQYVTRWSALEFLMKLACVGILTGQKMAHKSEHRDTDFAVMLAMDKYSGDGLIMFTQELIRHKIGADEAKEFERLGNQYALTHLRQFRDLIAHAVWFQKDGFLYPQKFELRRNKGVRQVNSHFGIDALNTKGSAMAEFMLEMVQYFAKVGVFTQAYADAFQKARHDKPEEALEAEAS